MLAICFVLALSATASDFGRMFEDRTLRIDYVFAGNSAETEVSVEGITSFAGWAGRRINLDSLLVKGCANMNVYDKASGKLIYCQAFSTLFQEWQQTDGAAKSVMAYETPMLMPCPKAPVKVEITLRQPDGKYSPVFAHDVDPHDILVRRNDADRSADYTYIMKNGDSSECIDLLFVPEGYTAEEMPEFLEHVRQSCEILFAHNGFAPYRDRFNVAAAMLPSQDSGVSVPREGVWKHTLLGAHFDTFYSERYLTTSNMKDLHRAIEGMPYEHIIILANTPVYGGGGIFNYYMLTTALHDNFPPVLVHEFGHSFAGLGDEYFYEDDISLAGYSAVTEPYEPNLTTLCDFASKWKSMLPAGTPVPTPDDLRGQYLLGVFEGGGYMFKGVYRPVFEDCRMKNNVAEGFCPVCEKAVADMIKYTVGE